MRFSVPSIAVGVLGSIPKYLEKRLEDLKDRGLIKTIHTNVLLISARVHIRVLQS